MLFLFALQFLDTNKASNEERQMISYLKKRLLKAHITNFNKCYNQLTMKKM